MYIIRLLYDDTFILLLMDGLGRLYNPGLPLHLVKGYEYGFDIHLSMYYAKQHLGDRPHIIRQDDLRLIPSESPGDCKLCYLAKDTEGPAFMNESGETRVAPGRADVSEL